MNYLYENQFGGDFTVDLPASGVFTADDFIFFDNDFLLSEYYKVLTGSRLLEKVKKLIIEENKTESEQLNSIKSIEVNFNKYFGNAHMFLVTISHDKTLNKELIDVFFQRLYDYVNQSVKHKVVEIYNLYELNFFVSLSDSIKTMKS